MMRSMRRLDAIGPARIATYAAFITCASMAGVARMCGEIAIFSVGEIALLRGNRDR